MSRHLSQPTHLGNSAYLCIILNVSQITVKIQRPARLNFLTLSLSIAAISIKPTTKQQLHNLTPPPTHTNCHTTDLTPPPPPPPTNSFIHLSTHTLNLSKLHSNNSPCNFTPSGKGLTPHWKILILLLYAKEREKKLKQSKCWYGHLFVKVFCTSLNGSTYGT